VSDRRWVIMHELRGEPEPSLEDQIERISPCDLLLVEGAQASSFAEARDLARGQRQAAVAS